MSSTAIAWGLVLALVGIIGGLLTEFVRRNKTTADTDLSDASADNQRSQAWSALTTQQTEWSKFVAEELKPIREELRAVRGDVKTLKGERDHEREQRRLSNDYVRTLAEALRPFAQVPAPPDGLDLD